MKLKIIVLLLLFQQFSWAQDERIFRKAVLGAYAPSEDQVKLPTNYGYRANSAMYRIDLTGDGYKEGIVFEKIDGENWLHIHDNGMKRVISFPLEAKGVRAHVYKIILSQVAKSIKALQVYFYEGFVKGLEFHGSSRLYLITYRNEDLSTMVLSKGPQFFVEAKESFHRYYLKKMRIALNDLDGDGIKDLVISKHMINIIYLLDKDLHWKRAGRTQHK